MVEQLVELLDRGVAHRQPVFFEVGLGDVVERRGRSQSALEFLQRPHVVGVLVFLVRRDTVGPIDFELHQLDRNLSPTDLADKGVRQVRFQHPLQPGKVHDGDLLGDLSHAEADRGVGLGNHLFDVLARDVELRRNLSRGVRGQEVVEDGELFEVAVEFGDGYAAFVAHWRGDAFCKEESAILPEKVRT